MKKIKLISKTACLIALLGITHVNVGWAKSAEDKVKGWVDNSADALKKGIDKCGDNIRAIQDYLDKYSWKDMIKENPTSGPATLRNLKLNEYPKAIVVKPGQKIKAEVNCDLDKEQCSVFGLYRIVVGLKGEGPQAVIGNETGLGAGKTIETFKLTAPQKPGIYRICFRTVDAFFKTTALDAWKDKKGNEPGEETTIGVMIVKK